MKAKFMRLVLVQKERFYWGASWPGRMVDSCLKEHLPFLLKPTVLVGIGRGGLFLSSYLASFQSAGVLWINLSSFWWLSVRTSACCCLGQWGRLPMLPDCLWYQGHWGWGEPAGPVSGSLEMLQPSACLSILDNVPAHLGNQLESAGYPCIPVHPCPLHSPCMACPSEVGSQAHPPADGCLQQQ